MRIEQKLELETIKADCLVMGAVALVCLFLLILTLTLTHFSDRVTSLEQSFKSMQAQAEQMEAEQQKMLWELQHD